MTAEDNISIVKTDGPFTGLLGKRKRIQEYVSDHAASDQPPGRDIIDVETGMNVMIRSYKELCDQIPEMRQLTTYPCENHFKGVCALAYECKYGDHVFTGRNNLFYFLLQYVFQGNINPVMVRDLVQEVYELAEICQESVYTELKTS